MLAFCAQTSAQKGVLWWAAHHRVHHRHSDTELDPHSRKVHGFWESRVGWIVGDLHERTDLDLVKDLAKYPELVWLDKYHWLPALLLGVEVTVLGQWVNGGNLNWLSAGWSTLLIGFFLSTVMLYHATFAIPSLGEGWHNHHHYYQSSTRHGFFWWEVDITYYVIRLLGMVGLEWEIREVPGHVKYNKEKLLKA